MKKIEKMRKGIPRNHQKKELLGQINTITTVEGGFKMQEEQVGFTLMLGCCDKL